MVSCKRYTLFVVVTMVLLLWAYMASRSVVVIKEVAEVKFLSELEKNIDNVGTIIIHNKGNVFKVHFENGQWVMPDKYSYIVNTGKIRDLVQNSANAAIIEKKTTNPEDFVVLGLNDPKEADSDATRITFLNNDETVTYADYIKGKSRKGMNGDYQGKELYARLFNDNQAYLIRGDLNFELNVNSLLGGETFAIKRDKLSSISFNYLQNQQDNFTISKNTEGQADFAITQPENKEVKALGKVDAIAASLEYIELQDAVPIEGFSVKEPELLIQYKTFAGLVVDAKIFKYQENTWIILFASADSENQQALADAEKINKLAAGWVYKVDFKSAGNFYYKLDDLVKE